MSAPDFDSPHWIRVSAAPTWFGPPRVVGNTLYLTATASGDYLSHAIELAFFDAKTQALKLDRARRQAAGLPADDRTMTAVEAELDTQLVPTQRAFRYVRDGQTTAEVWTAWQVSPWPVDIETPDPLLQLPCEMFAPSYFVGGSPGDPPGGVEKVELWICRRLSKAGIPHIVKLQSAGNPLRWSFQVRVANLPAARPLIPAAICGLRVELQS